MEKNLLVGDNLKVWNSQRLKQFENRILQTPYCRDQSLELLEY